MPELPDVEAYLAALRPRVAGTILGGIRITSPFVLRSVEPASGDLVGRRVQGVARMGKRIVLGLEEERYIVIHLMIAGRLRWEPPGAPVPKGAGLAAFDFASGSLILTEAGRKRRASLHLVRGAAALATHDPGGLEVLDTDLDAFRGSLTRENHTLKRALTDPRLFSGIGNAYSDEILHAARLSPLQWTSRLTPGQVERLYRAVVSTLSGWRDRLKAAAGDGWPEKVTAFRDGMAVHGRFGQPCPVCGTPVQRIRYAENEVNYCPTCQTEGRLLADRGLSRLLRQDWPRSLEEMETRIQTARRADSSER